MATNDIGRVTPIWRGFFSSATTYELNDIVIDTAGSVWWHKSPAQTTGEIPEAGEIWDAVIDMSVFSGLIQAAITTAQTALAAAQEAVAEVSADTERAETAAQNAETSALNAAESAASVGAQAQAAERSAEAAAGSATGAAGSAQAAAGSKSDAEAYAVGKRGGEDVGSTDPTFHNNAKYYSEQAESSADAAAQSAEVAQDVLDSIPADYSTLSGEVGNLKESLNDVGAFTGIDFHEIVAIAGNNFITPNGIIQNASGNYHVSEPIQVTAGDEIHFTCTVAGANIAVIALCDSDSTNIVPVVVGVSGNVSNEYVYTVQETGYIILCYRYDEDYKLYILAEKSNNNLIRKVNSNTKLLKNFCGTTDKEYIYVNGKYFVTNLGEIGSAVGTYHITKPISVKKGERVIFIATPALASSVISTCDSNSENITPKVLSSSDGTEAEYIYDVETDGYIILSYNYTENASLYILDEYSNIRLKEQIDEIVKEKYNLINHKTLIDNTSINNDGTLSQNTQYAITQKIFVEPETTYAYRNIYRIVYFNDDDRRISTNNIYEQIGTGTFTTPANTAYIIASVMKFNTQIGKVYDSTEWEIIKSNVVVPYTQQQIEINGYRIADSIPITHDAITEFRRWDKICFDKEPVVLAETESDATTAEDRMTSAIIAKYDALMADNPLYISKSALGIASDGITTIYRYDFKTPGSKIYSGSIPISANEKTKIILISGVHPEFGGIYGLYNAMREITNNPDLANIKNGVHFIVIPTVNPYGIDTKNRKNANGVDIARNFEIDFVAGTDPTSSTYAGTEPLSEPESQIVNAVLESNKDAIMFASCHSFQLSSDNDVIWGSCASMYTTNVTAKLIEKLSYAWRAKYTSIIPQTIDTILGIAGISTESGSEGKQATKYGIQGLTLESSDYFPYESQNPHTSFAISRASEVYLNFIAITLGLWESSDPKDLSIIGLH